MGAAIKAVIGAVFAAGVLGASGYFAYEWYWKPRGVTARQERAAEEMQAQIPPPDPADEALRHARRLASDGKSAEAREAFESLLLEYPQAPASTHARHALGELNAAAFFTPGPGPMKTAYSVVQGDALAKIARRLDSDAELIYRVNNLDSINLQIGQVLEIPVPDTSVEIDCAAKTLTLALGGTFFKTYPLVSAAVPGAGNGRTLEGSVVEKFAVQGDTRVAFGTKEYAGAARTVLLSTGRVALRASREGAEPPPAGITLAPGDLDEIFLLVRRGTPVTVR